LRPLIEDVPARKRRETENSAKQEEHRDVEVHGYLLMRTIRAVWIGGLPEVKPTC
jgi:hypothetical protein